MVAFGILTNHFAIADINLDFSNYRVGTAATIKIMGGVISAGDIDKGRSSVTSGQSPSNTAIVTNIFNTESGGGNVVQYFATLGGQTCPANFDPSRLSDTDYDILAQWINGIVAQQNTMTYYNGIIPSYDYYKYPGVRWMGFNCVSASGQWFRTVIPTEGVAIIVPPPQEGEKSVCTLNSQNLNLSYSSATLNVDGLSQSASLVVSCSSGDAKNYNLKLTGSNVTNGRLNFGNGVSAQISLNGTQVQANGSGIQLNSLVSGSININSVLSGVATTPGTTNANGVLILDAL